MFVFEKLTIKEAKTETRVLNTPNKASQIATKVRIFQVRNLNLQLDLLYCQAENGELWIACENVRSNSAHVRRLDGRTRLGIYEFENQYYCRLRQMVKKEGAWANLKKVPLSEIGKFSSQSVKKIVSDFGGLKLGRLEEIVKKTDRTRSELGILFEKENVELPLVSYILTHVLPLI